MASKQISGAEISTGTHSAPAHHHRGWGRGQWWRRGQCGYVLGEGVAKVGLAPTAVGHSWILCNSNSVRQRSLLTEMFNLNYHEDVQLDVNVMKTEWSGRVEGNRLQKS